jgi:WD40 repeat protein
LASGSDDHTIKLWQVSSGECVSTLEGHQNWVMSVAFSPDGKQLASGSDDHTIKLWQVSSGECVSTLEGHENWVMSVAFSPDGKQLASGSSDATNRIWDVATGDCIAVLDDRPYAGLNITGATGLSPAQRLSLRALGAIEDS